MLNVNLISSLVAKSLVKLGAIPVVPTGAANPKITKQQGKKVGGAVRRQKDF